VDEVRKGGIMKIFTRYVLKGYSKLLILIFMALASIYTLILFFEVLDDALENKAPMISILYYLLYNQARVTREMLPLAFFFATLAYVIISNKTFELVALRALGVKSYRALVPMAFLAGAVGCLMVLWNMNVAPWGIARSTEVRKAEIKKEKQARLLRYTNLWMKHGDTACFIHFFDEKKRVFKDVKCIWLKEGHIQSVAMAPQARWEKGQWQLETPTLLDLTGGTIQEKNPPVLPLPLDISPRTLLEQKKEPWEMTYGELKDYINAMEKEGYSAPQLKMELYQRISLAFAPLVLVLLVFPLALRPPREGGWQAILLSFGALVGYWSANSLFTLMGRGHWLPPILAAFIPPLTAAAGGIWYLRKKEG